VFLKQTQKHVKPLKTLSFQGFFVSSKFHLKSKNYII